MKKSILLTVTLLLSVTLMAGNLPNENISLGRAFSHCFSTSSYVWWLVATLVTFISGVVYLVSKNKKEGWSLGSQLLLFVLSAALLSSILYRPLEVSANTTNEQADRGVYIGY